MYGKMCAFVRPFPQSAGERKTKAPQMLPVLHGCDFRDRRDDENVPQPLKGFFQFPCPRSLANHGERDDHFSETPKEAVSTKMARRDTPRIRRWRFPAVRSFISR